MLIDRNAEAAIEYVSFQPILLCQPTLASRYAQRTIAQLLQGKIDMSQLVITKALAKEGQWLTLFLLAPIIE